MIELLHKVGTPWAAMDCKAAVSFALRRMGIPVASDAFDGHPELWERVEDVQRGDVILSRPDGRLHVAVVTDPQPGRGLAFTSDMQSGVRFVALARALVGAEGVYRYRR